MPVTSFFDTNNLIIRAVHIKDVKTVDKSTKKVMDIDWKYWEYIVFTSIYTSLFKVKNTREVVLAIDDKASWRYGVWPRYKEDRKKKKDKNTEEFPYDELFERYDAFMSEIRNHLPIKVMKVKGAEGDDIIGCITRRLTHDVHIISSDKDFLQLSSNRVKVYDPLKQCYVSHPNPEIFLTEQCLIGQSKDSIFNIITPIDWPEGKRKPGFGEKACEKAMVIGVDKFLKDKGLEERFKFNYQLMSFSEIPEALCDTIMDEYNSYKYPDPAMIWEFIKMKDWPEYTDRFTQLENKFMELY